MDFQGVQNSISTTTSENQLIQLSKSREYSKYESSDCSETMYVQYVKEKVYLNNYTWLLISIDFIEGTTNVIKKFYTQETVQIYDVDVDFREGVRNGSSKDCDTVDFSLIQDFFKY